MEEMLDLEQRVWQRVRGLQSPEGNLEKDVEELIRLSREQTAALKGRHKALYGLESENLALLTALYHLRFGRRLPAGKPGQRGRDACRRRAEKMLRLYVRLESHPSLGALFTDLTRRQRSICAMLEG